MELTIEQALLQGVAAHKEGKLEDAERLYRAILQSQPEHADANHNLGVMAVSVNKADAALPLFKTALEANPKIEQFWLSYIDALTKEKQFENAKKAFERCKRQGVSGETLNILEKLIVPKTQTENVKSVSPSQQHLNSLIGYYQTGRYGDAEKLAVSITQEFLKHQSGWKILGAILKQTGRVSESLIVNQVSLQLAPQDAKSHNNLGLTLQELGRVNEAKESYRKSITLNSDYAEAHSNLGTMLEEIGKLDEAEPSYRQAITLKFNYAEAHNNLGVTLKELGRLDEAEASNRQAIALKFDYAEAHNNLGVTLKALGRLDEAEASNAQAIVLKPGFPEALWNISSVEKTIEGAEHWIDQCLMVDANHISAKLTKAALRFYQGDKDSFFNLMQSEFKEHPYMRSFFWIFNQSNLPTLYFNRWNFLTQSLSKVYAQDLFMNSVCGGQQLSNTLLSILKKAMVLIRLQACQTIGMAEMVVLR